MSVLHMCFRRSSSSGPSENFSRSLLKDTWVYVANDGKDISTLEGHCETFDAPKDPLGDGASEDCDRSRTSKEASEGQEGVAAANIISIRDIARARTLIHDLRDSLHFLKLDAGALDIIEVDLDGIEGASVSSNNSFHDSNSATDQISPRAAFPLDTELETYTGLSETSSLAPSVLEDYFDKACEIFVTKERLTELEQEKEYLCPTVQPGSPQDCECQLLNPQIYCEYDDRRQQLHKALATAEFELDSLRKTCVSQGVEPELHRFRRISETGNTKKGLVLEGYQTFVAPVRSACDALGFH